jgi:hypothetical protein
MAKGIITSFRVEAATNGYSLEYCIKTKQPPQPGQTYSNTEYNEKNEVFMEKDKEALMARIGKLIGIVRDGEDEEDDMDDMPDFKKEEAN